MFIFAALFGLAVAGSAVQFAVIRRPAFSFRTALVSGIIAVLFVVLVATVVGYFLTRVRINDHYEVSSVFMAIAAANPAIALRLQSPRPAGRVAELGSLDATRTHRG